ncbi:maleylpyruvate isomerase family mycothiol-dependent enzyme [Cryobacterium sp. CG_9.6]|uniref:maleylpyruvate isomerase family mycothiol-dependent enzyme n=1 Tax=Cryobacterium sp. CG_9.6 TaxID=2760710 RepID=UPI0024769355|nr:maleylpyruvate isomerase family mycothiol-dependent enzyme [Cryobacterium sp. CG_9.6]MDH6236188.1 maleylpyruvate isomerase [Cryobacterium sp. CG_9.6]
MSTDAPLTIVREGTALFEAQLNELSDAQLDEPSLLPDWSRRHVVAHVGYNALAIARLVSWAETGVETPMFESREARNAEIATGAALPAAGLRKLSMHAGMLLDSAWQHLPEEKWAAEVQTAQGRMVEASFTIWMRTREVWIHAVDLNVTAGFANIPAPVLQRILGDILESWATRGELEGVRLEVSGVDGLVFGDRDARDPLVVSGDLAALTHWASGRLGARVTCNHPVTSVAPSWL